MKQVTKEDLNALSIIRQIKIDLITDTHNPITDWFSDLWSRLYIIETDVYHTAGGEFIYYIMLGDRKKFIFVRDDKKVRFWCGYTHYWSILENKFDLKYTDIQAITKLLVDNALNNDIETFGHPRIGDAGVVDNVLNNDIATPCQNVRHNVMKVDNVLNNVIAIPEGGNNYSIVIAENVLTKVV